MSIISTCSLTVKLLLGHAKLNGMQFLKNHVSGTSLFIIINYCKLKKNISKITCSDHVTSLNANKEVSCSYVEAMQGAMRNCYFTLHGLMTWPPKTFTFTASTVC